MPGAPCGLQAWAPSTSVLCPWKTQNKPSVWNQSLQTLVKEISSNADQKKEIKGKNENWNMDVINVYEFFISEHNFNAYNPVPFSNMARGKA